jgi:CHAT domain-containing protein/tetratricopeptide (TPR) repeat protein
LRVVAAAFLFAGCAHVGAQQTIGPATRMDLSFAGGELRHWEIHLQKDDYLHAVFLQKGIHVALHVLGPGNKDLLKVDSPNGDWGPAPIFFVAAQEGTFSIVASALGDATQKGGLEFSMSKVRPATEADRKLASLENLGYGILGTLEGDLNQQLAQSGKALAAFQECGDRYAAALTSSLIADLTTLTGQPDKAVGIYEQALVMERELKDRRGESITLNGLGDAYYYANRFAQAIGSYELELAAQRELRDQRGEGTALTNLGASYMQLSQHEKAITSLEQALAARRAAKERRGEAETLNYLGNAFGALSQYAKAIGYYEQVLTIARELKDRASEGSALNNLGAAYDRWSQHEKAIGYYEQALVIRREMKNRQAEGTILNNLGGAYESLGRYEKAIDNFEQSLAIQREVKNRRGEGSALNNLGFAYDGLSQYEKAISYYEQAMAIEREVKDRAAEGTALANIGKAYDSLSQYGKGLGYLEQALAIHREVKDRAGECNTLGNLGEAYNALSQYEKAIGYHEQALAIARELTLRSNEGGELSNLGTIFLALTQYEKAIQYFDRALAIRREVKDRFGEGVTLNNLGYAYDGLRQYQKAIAYYEQSLAIAREVKSRSEEATELDNLGEVYSALHQYEKAIGYHQQTLTIRREVKDRSGEGLTLNNLGGEYRRMGQFDKAVEFFEQALIIHREVNSRQGEGVTLGNLMETQRQRSQPALAICYGKLAINAFQQIRFENSALKADLQVSLDESFRKYYADLASLLAGQGRIFEALEVMDLLKQKEVSEYLRSASPIGGEMRLLPLNSSETRAVALITSVTEYRGLIAKPNRTPAETSRLTELYTQVRSGVNDFNNQVAAIFSQPGQQQDLQAVKQHTAALQTILSKLGPSAVAIYTLLAEKELHLFLVTPEAALAFSTPVERSKVYELITALQEKLRNAASDPLPETQALYKLLVAPLRTALDQTHAQVIYWHLHDQLRYVPVAALHDGSGYLAEHYQNILLNVQNQASLLEPRISQWTASGFGVTKSHGNFSALPNVGYELQQIIGDSPTPLSGQILLDEKFTSDAFVQQMFQQRPVVHIASHFYFDPKDGKHSFLLLGDGNKLTIEEMEGLPNLFQGVDLVTFSACETALGQTDTAGIEIDALSDVAMLKGARAIMASLWPVDDASTALLMSEFYRLRQRDHLTKAEALRRVQAAMIHGELRPASDLSKARGAVPAAAPRRAQDFSNPHYWAPFILMGNMQ